MIPGYLTPVVDHVWQSTLFVAAAGLLTIALRNNRAAVRYGLWLAASAKFLLPFSLLVALGSQVEWGTAPAIAPAGLSVAMEQMLTPPAFRAANPTAAITVAPAVSPIPTLLFGAWAIGFAAVLFSWWRQWRPIRAALGRATPLRLHATGLLPSLAVMSSPDLREPGIVGVRRPVLLLPHGIADRLQPSELHAIVAHELCHVRRRDNLAAAMHMLVEALFWFHPLVWWLEARLVEERERACDEDVLRGGTDPQAYAEGILTVCKLYLESRLQCVAGVSGANLKRRIEEIMTNRIVQKLDAGRKMLLAGVGMVAVAGPIAVGIGARQVRAQSPQRLPAFEVVSVKPYKSLNPGKGGDLRDPAFLPGGRFTSRAPLIMVIAAAYGVPFFGPGARISGGPAWVNSLDLVFDIEATPAKDAAPDGLSAGAQADKGRQMLQALLADRFKLALRRETKEVTVYVLMLGKDGPKLPKADIQEKDCPEAPPANAPADGNAVCHRFNGGRGRGLHARAVDMSDLVSFVQGWTDRPLFDDTGLKGLYQIETEPWLPMELGSTRTNVDGVDVANLPSLFTVFERLGLKMVSQKRNVDMYVIDRVEKPTGN